MELQMGTLRKKLCLEDDPFLLGRKLFRGELLSFGRVAVVTITTPPSGVIGPYL